MRLSLEWLAEAERRRSLSSSEVAASFRCPLCHQFGMEFRSGRYGEQQETGQHGKRCVERHSVRAVVTAVATTTVAMSFMNCVKTAH